MGRVISSFVYNVSCTYTRVDIVKHIQTRISGSCTGVQMEEVYKSTPFLSRILFQKHHIHSGLQRTTSLGYPPQLPHRRRQDIYLFIHSFIRSFIHSSFYSFTDSSPPATAQEEVGYSYFHSSFHLPIYPSFYPFILSFFLLSFFIFLFFIQSSFRLFFTFQSLAFLAAYFIQFLLNCYFVRFSLIYFYFSKIGKAKSFKCNKLQNVYYNLSN